MLHHYITKYRLDDGSLVAEAWIQLNLFGRRFCFSRRKLEIEGGLANVGDIVEALDRCLRR